MCCSDSTFDKMKLTKEQFIPLFHGAVAVTSEDQYTIFRRYAEAQEDYYEDTNADFRQKCRASSGIVLDMISDTKTLSLSCKISRASSRQFYYFDLYVDGKLFDRKGEDKFTERKPTITFRLPEGKKRVTLWFPCLFKAAVKEIAVDDNASLEPVKKAKTMLCIGDSITHGYDAKYPSHSYPARLARKFDCNMINQGIGGDVYHVGNLGEGIGFTPDLITVALGTNDWSNRKKEHFDISVEGFYKKLAELYPDTPVAVITPFWRGDNDRTTKVGSFDYATEKIIQCASAAIKDLTVIDGKTLIDHDPKFFSPDVLHPNDDGFEMLSERLFPVLEKLL